jgi:outer membrane immunogenic protein
MRFQSLPMLAAASLAVSFGAAGAAFAQTATTDWSGAYVGVSAGASFGHSKFTLPGDLGDTLQQNSDSKTRFVGGALLGYNHQFGATLVGLEADVNSPQGTEQVTACTTVDGCWTSAHDSFTTLNNLKLRASGRIRARLGEVVGDNLFYVAGGYSIADSRLDLVGLCYDPANPSVPTTYNFSRSKTLSGFNVGGGVEHAIGAHLIARAEVIYDSYGSQTYAGEAPEWNARKISIHDTDARVAISYKF